MTLLCELTCTLKRGTCLPIVSYTKLGPISQRFADTAEYWVSFSFLIGCSNLTHSFGVNSVNITINHTSPETGVIDLGYILPLGVSPSSFSQCDVVSSETFGGKRRRTAMNDSYHSR